MLKAAAIAIKKILGKLGFEFCTKCGNHLLIRFTDSVVEYAPGLYGKVYDHYYECKNCGVLEK